MLSFWAVGWPPLLVQSTGSIWNRLWYVIHLLQIGLVAILLKFCNMIKVPSHELFPNPPWSKYINKFSFNTKIWCVSNKMLCGGRNIYSQKEYWLLIGHARSRDMDTGLWLAETKIIIIRHQTLVTGRGETFSCPDTPAQAGEITVNYLIAWSWFQNIQTMNIFRT